MQYKKYIIIISLVLIAVSTAAVGGYFFGKNYEKQILIKDLDFIRPIRQANSSYKFIDPLLAYVVPSADQTGQYSDLKNQLTDFINNQKDSNSVTDASVFFYDLNRSRWIGINETDKYDPASMLKVVIMMAYFKKAEKNPSILSNILEYNKKISDLLGTDPFFSESSLQIGQDYNVNDLIRKMIISSDNGAEILLLSNIDNNSLNDIYKALNIKGPDDTAGAFQISPRLYSLFFRVLYSSTYLSEDMSEKALSILSGTTFSEGLVASLPKDITVAHKFGEHVAINNNEIQTVELHDCGIVYYPVNPYFLCVMTRGKNLEDLKGAIKNISQLVYENYK